MMDIAGKIVKKSSKKSIKEKAKMSYDAGKQVVSSVVKKSGGY